MGVETGNEYLRQNVLNKKVPNEKIRNAARYIKRYGIKLSTYNMLGLPGETIDNALETYILNKEIGTDFIWCSLLQPYPGTSIEKYVREKGFFKEVVPGGSSLDESYFVSTRIRLENEKEIVNLQKLMQILLQFHASPSVVRKIIKLPQNFLFHLLYRLNFVYNKMRFQNIRLIPVIKLGIHSLTFVKRER
jgi:uncharacterized radical SAM superfamily protein